jgi:hypothetical protein
MFSSGKHTALPERCDAGLSEPELTDLSGHETPGVFERYVTEDTARWRENFKRRDILFRKRFADREGPDADKIAKFPNVSEDSR